MSYKLDIHDNAMRIQGLYGKYEASDNGNGGFEVSVLNDASINEVDADGDEYSISYGQEWNIPVNSLAELNGFIQKCEEERLWNYLPGPVCKMRPDIENGILYIKGCIRNFIIGEDEKGIYVDSTQNQKTHDYVDDIFDAALKIVKEDKWWNRDADAVMELVKDMRCTVMITSGGNLKLGYRNKIFIIGQKDDGSFWVNVTDDQEKHVYYKENFKDVMSLFA